MAGIIFLGYIPIDKRILIFADLVFATVTFLTCRLEYRHRDVKTTNFLKVARIDSMMILAPAVVGSRISNRSVDRNKLRILLPLVLSPLQDIRKYYQTPLYKFCRATSFLFFFVLLVETYTVVKKYTYCQINHPDLGQSCGFPEFIRDDFGMGVFIGLVVAAFYITYTRKYDFWDKRWLSSSYKIASELSKNFPEQDIIDWKSPPSLEQIEQLIVAVMEILDDEFCATRTEVQRHGIEREETTPFSSAEREETSSLRRMHAGCSRPIDGPVKVNFSMR